MKTTTGLSFLLLMAVLCNVMFASAQGSNTYNSTTVAGAYTASELLQKRWQISMVSSADPKNFLEGWPSSEKNLQWKIFLALQLVKYPDLDQRQKRAILDAISLPRSEFFTTSNHRSAQKTKADHALESLKARAFRTFSNTPAAELFGNTTDAKAEADLLKLYYDISALPLKKRRASFRNSSANDRSGLWRTHLALFLVKRPELNEWQKAIILSAMSLCTSEYFEIRSGDSLWNTKVRDPSRVLEAQIVNAFSLEDGTKIFATLGDDADLAKSSASVFLHRTNYKPHSDSGPYKQWTLSKFGGQDVELERGSCECSTESNYCPIWKANCSGGGCGWAQDGCGTFWSYPCN